MTNNNNNNNNNSNNMATGWEGAAAQGISMLGGFIGANSQHQRQKELMGIQFGNQRELNRQGHNLQYDLWKKTSYPAQLEMMKKAGLNPGLMYKQGGSSGQTGSQTGGSAASGNAAGFNPMDVGALKMGAELDLIKAQAEDLRSQARKRDGVDTDLSTAMERKANAEAVLNELEGDAKKKFEDKYIKGLVAEWETSGYTADLQKVAVGLASNGMHNRTIATVIETLFGWDMTEENSLDKKVDFLPDHVVAALSSVGIEFDPGMSRRAIMNSVIAGWIAGKVINDKFDDIMGFLNPNGEIGFKKNR